MKKFILGVWTLIALSCQAQPSAGVQEEELIFRNVNIVPMDKEEVLTNYDILINDGKISDMGKTGTVKTGKNARVIDASGKYLMPGLAEMHAHVPPVNDMEVMKPVVRLFALKGITTIRGMLGHPLHIELRKKINNGEILGPRFISSGPSFNGNSVKSPEAARKMVNDQKNAGYDFFKLHPGLTRQNFDAMAEEAKRVGMTFAGHVSFDVGVWRAIEAGYATIDHLDGFVESLVPGIENMTEQQTGLFGLFIADKVDESRIQRLMDSLKANNIWVVPTQALAERWFHPDRPADELAKDPEMKYMNSGTLNGWVNAKKNLLNNPNYKAETVRRLIDVRKKLIKACQDSGVGLLLGSDAPQIFDVPGFSTHHELAYLVDAGLTPYQALRTGTINTGKFLKRDDIGVIRKGAVADLLLLNGNPLQDIKHTWDIEGVVLRGVWLDKGYIEGELKKLEGGIK